MATVQRHLRRDPTTNLIIRNPGNQYPQFENRPCHEGYRYWVRAALNFVAPDATHTFMSLYGSVTPRSFSEEPGSVVTWYGWNWASGPTPRPDLGPMCERIGVTGAHYVSSFRPSRHTKYCGLWLWSNGRKQSDPTDPTDGDPPSEIKGEFVHGHVFKFWYYQSSPTCPVPARQDPISMSIEVKNMGLLPITVNGVELAQTESWNGDTIEDSGYGIPESNEGYAGGTTVTVVCPD
jgi:hypothetical protein